MLNKIGLGADVDRRAARDGSTRWRRARNMVLVSFAAGAMMIAGCASGSDNSAGAPPLDTTPKGVTSDAAVEQILQNSCYSCHSNGGSAPWYAAISPSYMLSSSARGKVNFSDWNNYDQATKAKARSLAASVVAKGEMPPWDFTLLHPSAGLTDPDKAEIAKWAAAAPALPAH